MGGIANGIAYHGGFLPYCATFLTFSDYMRGSVRIAALSGLHVTYVWTHDSVGLGEDGPTHQPVEHYAALRAIPNLWFVRPGDGNEAAAAWALAVERPRSRAPRPGPWRSRSPARSCRRCRARRSARARASAAAGTSCARPRAARRTSSSSAPGSELQLCAAAADALEAEGIPTRVVSLPCWERFEAQDAAYRESVLPPAVRKRVTVEAGVSLGWERWAGDEGAIIGPRPLRRERAGRDDPQGVRVHGRATSPTSGGGSSAKGSSGRVGVSDPSTATRTATAAEEDGTMRVAFAADHAGAAFKDELLGRLRVTGPAHTS